MKTYPKTDPWTPVQVTWEDCEARAAEQHETVESTLKSYKPCIRTTVGYWVGVVANGARTAIMIATDDDRQSLNGGFGGPMQIPLGMVESIQVLGKPLSKTWKPTMSRPRGTVSTRPGKKKTVR